MYTNLSCLTSIEAFALQKREFRIRHVYSYYNSECIVNNIKIWNSVRDNYRSFLLFFFYKYFQSILLNRHSLNMLLSTICSKSQKNQTFQIVIYLFLLLMPLVRLHGTEFKIKSHFIGKKCFKNSEVPHLFCKGRLPHCLVPSYDIE